MAKETAAQKREREEAEARRKAALEGEDGSDGADTSDAGEDWNEDEGDGTGLNAEEGIDDEDDGIIDLSNELTGESAPVLEYATHPDDTSGSSLGGSSGASIQPTDAPDPKDDDRSDVQRVEIVQAKPDENAFVAGEALTPGQLAGLDPLDPQKNAEEAQDRAHRTNMQTTHEMDNGLDPTSSDPNAGVTPNVSYTAAATGAPPSDMSGRPPMAASDEAALRVARTALEAAKARDADRGEKTDRTGWRTPQEIGVAGGVMARLQSMFEDRLDVEEAPGGHFFPETGRRYRLK